MILFNKKNSPLYGLLFRILGLIVAISAITLQLFTNSIIGKGFMANHVLAYFTIQTNIITAFIFLALIIKTIIDSVKEGKLVLSHINSVVHLATVFYITITMCVYWLALAPMLGVGDSGLAISNTLFLHLFTPLFAIFDSLLFIKHGECKKLDTFKWLAYPIFYLILVIVIANVSDVPYYQFNMGGTKIPLHYPYPFLEPQVVGIGGMIGVMIGLLVFCLLFGLLYIVVDNKINSLILKRRENN